MVWLLRPHGGDYRWCRDIGRRDGLCPGWLRR